MFFINQNKIQALKIKFILGENSKERELDFLKVLSKQIGRKIYMEKNNYNSNIESKKEEEGL